MRVCGFFLREHFLKPSRRRRIRRVLRFVFFVWFFLVHSIALFIRKSVSHLKTHHRGRFAQYRFLHFSARSKVLHEPRTLAVASNPLLRLIVFGTRSLDVVCEVNWSAQVITHSHVSICPQSATSQRRLPLHMSGHGMIVTLTDPPLGFGSIL